MSALDLKIQADVSDLEELRQAVANDAEGIGILRTERLFRDLEYNADEEEQYRFYSEAVKTAQNKSITIRTFDGGPNLSLLNNWGIRYSINHPEFFRTQLKAILRSAVNRQVNIVLPGVADITQYKWAKEQLDIVKSRLAADGLEYQEHVSLGIMIEIPAVVMNFEMLVHEVSFFIIDSDRLLQLLMAVDDSTSEEIFKDPVHPAMLRTVKKIMSTKPSRHLNVSVCGKLAAMTYVTPIFKALGLKNAIVKPEAVPKIANLVNNLDDENAMRIAAKALALSSADRVKNYAASALEKLNLTC